MSGKYNYNYRTSKRKGGNGLLTLVIVIGIIIIGFLLVILNWNKIVDKFYDVMGMETTTTAGTTGPTESSGTSTTTASPTTESTGTTESGSQPTEDLPWYRKELEFSRSPINIEPLENEIRSFIYDFSGYYGVCFYDLTSGATFGINDIDYYMAASTIKIPLSLFIYNKVATEGLNLNTRMTYLEEDHEAGTGYIINHHKVGDEFTLRILCNYAIVYSDNIATNMLLREFGRAELKAFMREMGGEVVDDVDNYSCPRDMALYLKLLYMFEKEYPDLGREVITYLRRTHEMTGGYINTPEADQRLIRFLPDSIKRNVAHKTGNVAGGWHDVGIIYTDRPYILAVMTNGVLYDEVNDVIANISKKVYEYLANLETY